MSRKNASLPIWALLTMIVLVVLSGYLWFKNSQLNSEFKKQQSELQDLEKVNTELDQDYQASLETLESMKGDNEELNELIESQKKELAAQKEKVNNLIWSKRELNKARDEISNLKTMTESYVAEINTLKEENELLSAENASLAQKNATLNTQYVAASTENASLKTNNTELNTKNESLASENTGLSRKVNMASAIKINHLSLTGYSINSDGSKKKKKRRAKRMNMLEACIITETNMVVESGPQQFYLRIVDPLGEVLISENDGSGITKNELNQTDVRYSVGKIVTYNQEDLETCIPLKPETKIIGGDYLVEIYNNGYMVGHGTFKLK